MTTDTDKLVEMARGCGIKINHEPQWAHLRGEATPTQLAAFRDRIIASLCGDVEPVAWQKADRQETEDGWAIVGWLPCTKQEFNALLIPKRALCDASTVAALKARVAVLEESASQLAGVDLDGMVEAFHRIIDSQAQQSPFHNPVNADAALALRELRRLIPAIKAVALTKGQP